MEKVSAIIILAFFCNVANGQQTSDRISFNSPCFKSVVKTNRTIEKSTIKGYACKFVFIPTVENESDKTGNVYYRDWWIFFINSQNGYINIYPLKETNAKAHIPINKLTDTSKVLYMGDLVTLQRRDFYKKYNTDDWQIDTLSHQIKIIHEKTFRYNKELITLINIQGWDLQVPKKCKTVEGYSLVYSNKRGFVGSYVYFFSKENETKAASFSFIGDQKLVAFMEKKHLLYYYGGGINWECGR